MRFGEYKIQLPPLGAGGWAVVYEAKHRELGTVAVKIGKETLEEEDLRTLIREFQIHSQLDHPHIVRICDTGVVRGVGYAAMEVLHGGTLQNLVDGDRLTPGQVVTVIQQLGSALEYASRVEYVFLGVTQCGIVHRDIKPHNVFLDGMGGVKLGDFGLARPISTSGKLSTRGVGTPPYMAPEQLTRLRDENGTLIHLSAACDVWQMGCMAYELLTGVTPFGPWTGDEYLDVIHRIQHEEPSRPESHGVDMPAPVWNVILSSLQKDPRNRPSIAQFSSVFSEAMNVNPEPLAPSAPAKILHEQRSTTPISLPPSLIPNKRRQDIRTVLIGVAAILVAIISVACFLRYSESGQRFTRESLVGLAVEDVNSDVERISSGVDATRGHLKDRTKEFERNKDLLDQKQSKLKSIKEENSEREKKINSASFGPKISDMKSGVKEATDAMGTLNGVIANNENSIQKDRTELGKMQSAADEAKRKEKEAADQARIAEGIPD